MSQLPWRRVGVVHPLARTPTAVLRSSLSFTVRGKGLTVSKSLQP